MKLRIIAVGASLFAACGALPSAFAQDEAERQQTVRTGAKLLDELDEVRAREDLLKVQRELAQAQLQQSAQMLNQIRLPLYFEKPGASGAPTDEEKKQRELGFEKAKQAEDKILATYLETSRELRRTSRRRAELEGETVSKTNQTNTAVEATNKGMGPKTSDLIKMDNIYINIKNIDYVRTIPTPPMRVEVFFRGREQALFLGGQAAEALLGALNKQSR